MSPENLTAALYSRPAAPGGSDATLKNSGILHNIFAKIKQLALYPSDDDPQSGWEDIELRSVWCDQSVWEIPWGIMGLQTEIVNAKKAGKRMRNITLTQLKGTNHFVSCDLLTFF